MEKNSTSLLVVSHDAGGAEVLASYIARTELVCQFVLAGPAHQIFERRLGRKIELIDLESAVAESDLVLCGTSWESDLEWHAVALARAAGKPVRCFLDHWSNYKERFVRNGVEVLPDELLVGDALSKDIATEIFPQLPVTLVPNPYFADIQDQLSQASLGIDHCSGVHALDVLFVCEPISEHAAKEHGNPRHWGYTEFEAIRFFLSNQDVLGAPIGRIVLRPHPSEKLDKYDEFLSDEFPNLEIGRQNPLLHEILESDVVVGCDTMAMVVGLMAKRRVISAIPPGGLGLTLPHTEIEKLEALISDQVAKVTDDTTQNLGSDPLTESRKRSVN